MADSTEGLLSERAKTHGDFRLHAETTQRIKTVMVSMPGWVNLSPSQKESLEMIAHKIGRILAGNADFRDHWDDIAGYSRLISNQIDNPV